MTRADIRALNFAAMTFNDCLRHLKTADEARSLATPLKVAVLRSYTVEPLEPVLTLPLIGEGFNPTFWFGGFNQYVQEALDRQSGLYQFRPDLVLLMIRIEDVMPGFSDAFGSRPTPEWESEMAARVEELGGLVRSMQEGLAAQVVVQNMTPPTPYFGVFDAQQSDSQTRLVEQFNRALAVNIAGTPGAYAWDFDGFVRAKGRDQLDDPRMWYVAKNPYKQSAYPAIACDLMRYVRSVLGRTKKCVVVDLDNTLWGGVIGEDGLEGVQLGNTYPGNCYRDFQKALLQLRDRGILLAINSKNNEEDVWRMLDEHPAMALRREHFSAVRVNWLDKADNLRSLARELNIGTDSLVFLDDNPVECELVRRELPECDVIVLPDKPYLLPSLLHSVSGIENIRLTNEDRQKAAMYRARTDRKHQQERYTNLDDFLRSLDIEVSIEAASAFSIPRIAQLTQKTNQMNMTTRRYTDAQIRARAADARSAVYAVSARDKFADEGIIGVVILDFHQTECLIDTLLLSCRVIGRGIEDVMASFVAETARERGARVLVGEFIETAKNQPARGFYERVGFRNTDGRRFELDISSHAPPPPSHIRLRAGAPEDRQV